ncbi:thiamine diphosphokinase [Sulfitobacter sp. 1A12779]|uniref:thiamine diphosphokinase n=1 Tax=Sulfitobacter sp. 1A12779 TaxID=3368599 RepID=UPI003745D47F
MTTSEHIVREEGPVTLLGGGEVFAGDIEAALALAPTCVAADSGAAVGVAAGVELAAVIGDLDSAPPEVLAQIPAARRHRIAEQESTDFDKALTRIDAPLVLGVGFTGARLDHQLAAFNALATHPHRSCILLGAHEIVLLAPPRITLPTAAGDVVSLMPLAPVTGRSQGLEWPIDGLDFAPGGRTGTSNRALGPVTLEIDGPDMLLILPRRLMAPLAAQLLRPEHAPWPARA